MAVPQVNVSIFAARDHDVSFAVKARVDLKLLVKMGFQLKSLDAVYLRVEPQSGVRCCA